MTNPANETRHNRTDDNQGGSPLGQTGGAQAGASRGGTPIGKRGGFGQQGRDKVYVKAQMGGGRSGSGNPASRGGTPGSFKPEERIAGHGGSPQVKSMTVARQYGKPGQAGVPGGKPTQPPPGAGNTSGLAYRRIAGRFKRAAMGARPTSSSGKYGSPPVTSNT